MEKKTDIRALSNKDKIQYIWDYYKFPILATIVGVSFVIYLIHHYVTYRDPLLNVIMINCNDSYGVSESGFDEFLENYNYAEDEDNYVSLSANLQFPDDADYSSSYNEYLSLTALVDSGGQDLFFGTGDVFLDYAEDGVFADLSDILSAELLEKYEDQLIYSTVHGQVEAYPCAIEITDNEWLKKNNYYDTCYFGIFYDNQGIEPCKQFAEFLLEY